MTNLHLDLLLVRHTTSTNTIMANVYCTNISDLPIRLRRHAEKVRWMKAMHRVTITRALWTLLEHDEPEWFAQVLAPGAKQ